YGQIIDVYVSARRDIRAAPRFFAAALGAIPPGDDDFDRLYARRNDAESINRNLDDTLWLGRAHSVGHRRQPLNLLGYALMVNRLALHRRQEAKPHAAA